MIACECRNCHLLGLILVEIQPKMCGAPDRRRKCTDLGSTRSQIWPVYRFQHRGKGTHRSSAARAVGRGISGKRNFPRSAALG